MGWFNDDSEQAQAYEQVRLLYFDCTDRLTGILQVMNAPHKASLTHELLAGAASYEVCLPTSLQFLTIFHNNYTIGRQGLRGTLR
jgi:hypothetical protein